MKKITILTALFLAILVSCSDGLDTVSGTINNAAYMNAETVSISLTDEGGEAVIEPRLAGLANTDMQLTVSSEDFFEQYNKTNNTQYQMLPLSEYELYEVGNETNRSDKGRLTVTIKKGQLSSRIGVKVSNLEGYSYGVRYAVPLRIVSAGVNILSNKDAVITLNRPFKTDVVKIKQGYGIKVQLDPNMPNAKEFSVQGQFMFLDGWATENQTTMVVGGYYTRIRDNGIQIKDGGADGEATWTKGFPIEFGKWYQITFTYTDADFKVYVNGKLIATFVRVGLEVTGGSTFHLFNPQIRYSSNQYVREVRLWNRVLTEKEINDNLYLPVDKNNENLLMYLPLDKENKYNEVTKYQHVVDLKKGRGLNHDTVSEEIFEAGVEWMQNVKFPAESLEIAD